MRNPVSSQLPVQDVDVVEEGMRLQTDTGRVARIGL